MAWEPATAVVRLALGRAKAAGERHRRACGGRGQRKGFAEGCEWRGCVPARTVGAIAAAARPG